MLQNEELTSVQEELITLMYYSSLTLEDRAGLFQFLQTEAAQTEMVKFLLSHRDASRDEIMAKLAEILKRKKQQ